MQTGNREAMEISPFVDSSYQFNGGIFDFAGDQRSFMELLGLQEFPQSPFELPPLDPVTLPPESSETVNSSSLSSSSDEADPVKLEAPAPEEEDEEKKPVKGNKKKGQKRPREPRVAFMTKSDVDHLEDGYRWRKYGQKAVKNSPFPRSYYRCTAATCGVKKRVERSCSDSTVVVTTYEGQHTHPSPVMPRGGHLARPPQQIPEFFAPPPVHLNDLFLPFLSSYLPAHPVDFRHVATSTFPTPHSHISAVGDRRCRNLTAADGLLQDLIPAVVMKKEN